MKNRYEIIDNGNVIASNMTYEIVNLLMLALLENEEINYPSVTIRKMANQVEEKPFKKVAEEIIKEQKKKPVDVLPKAEPSFMNEPTAMEDAENLFC